MMNNNNKCKICRYEMKDCKCNKKEMSKPNKAIEGIEKILNTDLVYLEKSDSKFDRVHAEITRNNNKVLSRLIYDSIELNALEIAEIIRKTVLNEDLQIKVGNEYCIPKICLPFIIRAIWKAKPIKIKEVK